MMSFQGGRYTLHVYVGSFTNRSKKASSQFEFFLVQVSLHR